MFIFDLDGTLVESRIDLVKSVNYTREHFGLEPLSFEAVVNAVGNGAPSLITKCFADSSVKVEEALPVYAAHYAEHLLDNTFLYEGIREVLDLLRSRNVPMAVVSNKPEAATKVILEKLGVIDHFSLVIGGNSGFSVKPDPAALLHCLEKCGESAETSWMIGDHYTDMEAGRRAGMKRGFALWGFGSPKDEVPDKELSHPSQITELV